MKTIVTLTIDHSDIVEPLGRQVTAFVTADRLAGNCSEEQHAVGWDALRDAVDSLGVGAVHIDTQRGWLAGWNKPGFEPEDTPQLFNHPDNAREYLQDELQRGMEQALEAVPIPAAEKHLAIRRIYSDAHEKLEAIPNFLEGFVVCSDYVWWVRRE